MNPSNPVIAKALFVLLFISAIIFAWTSDMIIPVLGITPCESCVDTCCEECLFRTNNQESTRDIFRPANLVEIFQSFSFARFLIFIILLSFLLLIAAGILGPSTWDWIRITFISLSMCILCIIRKHLPGPRLIPFSVLFTTSFVQDGHGMLPLLSCRLKDSVLIKVFNLTFGLVAGSILYAMGYEKIYEKMNV